MEGNEGEEKIVGDLDWDGLNERIDGTVLMHYNVITTHGNTP